MGADIDMGGGIVGIVGIDRACGAPKHTGGGGLN
jgi:hypothetical protein